MQRQPSFSDEQKQESVPGLSNAFERRMSDFTKSKVCFSDVGFLKLNIG